MARQLNTVLKQRSNYLSKSPRASGLPFFMEGIIVAVGQLSPSRLFSSKSARYFCLWSLMYFLQGLETGLQGSIVSIFSCILPHSNPGRVMFHSGMW